MENTTTEKNELKEFSINIEKLREINNLEFIKLNAYVDGILIGAKGIKNENLEN